MKAFESAGLVNKVFKKQSKFAKGIIMIVVLDKYEHFKDRVDEYAESMPGLDGYGYKEIADQVLKSKIEVTLASGNKYRVCELNGVEYGVGIEMYNDNIVIAKTLIHPYDINISKNDFRFNAKVKKVKSFG